MFKVTKGQFDAFLIKKSNQTQHIKKPKISNQFSYNFTIISTKSRLFSD